MRLNVMNMRKVNGLTKKEVVPDKKILFSVDDDDDDGTCCV